MVRAGDSHFSILYPTKSSKKMYSNLELEVMEDQVSGMALLKCVSEFLLLTELTS